jgi:hypothetical protein
MHICVRTLSLPLWHISQHPPISCRSEELGVRSRQVLYGSSKQHRALLDSLTEPGQQQSAVGCSLRGAAAGAAASSTASASEPGGPGPSASGACVGPSAVAIAAAEELQLGMPPVGPRRAPDLVAMYISRSPVGTDTAASSSSSSQQQQQQTSGSGRPQPKCAHDPFRRSMDGGYGSSSASSSIAGGPPQAAAAAAGSGGGGGGGPGGAAVAALQSGGSGTGGLGEVPFALLKDTDEIPLTGMAIFHTSVRERRELSRGEARSLLRGRR